jgi:hypothetical protein
MFWLLVSISSSGFLENSRQPFPVAIVWRLMALQTLSQRAGATSDTVQARTKWAISLIVESGSIYCIGLIGLIITTVVRNAERANIVFSGFVSLLYRYSVCNNDGSSSQMVSVIVGRLSTMAICCEGFY